MLRSVVALLLFIPNAAQDLFLGSGAKASCAFTALGPNVTLRGGVVMPTVSLGSGGKCHPDPDGTEQQCSSYNNTMMALANGYRGFHTALSYGNQAGLGAAVKDSGLPRESLFLMSMVPFHLLGYRETKAAVQASLEQMQLEYLDLVMVHHRAVSASVWPRSVASMRAFPDDWASPGSPVNNRTSGKASWSAPECVSRDATWLTCQDETWKALTELKSEGKVRAIGVSNWMVSNLQRMKDLGQELPSVNQVEQHIGWWDDEMLQWCQSNGVVVQAATPTGRAMMSLVKPGADPLITSIATKYGKTPAQISMRFLVDKGVASIPNSESSEHQRDNLDVFGFCLESAEVKALGSLALQCRDCDNCFKCWGDPADLMCTNSSTGVMFHCP